MANFLNQQRHALARADGLHGLSGLGASDPVGQVQPSRSGAGPILSVENGPSRTWANEKTPIIHWLI